MKTKIQVIDADYQIDNKTPEIRIFGKTSDGENVLAVERDFQPYFYATPSQDLDELREKIQEESFTDDKGTELEVTGIEEVKKKDGNEEIEALKIYTSVPPNVPKIEKQVYEMPETSECREYDIPFYKRYLIDKQIRPVKTIRVKGEEASRDGFDRVLKIDEIEKVEDEETEFEKLAFDLEVYEDEIIMASFASENYRKLLTTEEIDNEDVEVVEDERDLLERFIEIVTERDVDVLTGYNTDEYDFQRLRERCKKHNIELSLGRDGERMKFKRRGRFSGACLKGRMHLDLYPFIEHILAPGLDSETLDLDSVAQELLGREKDEMSWEEMKQSWKNKKDLEKFAKYALKDAELAYELGNEILPQMLELSRITGLIPFDTCRLTYGQLTENYLLREAYERDMISPNRPTRSERRKRQNQGAYSGGFVYEPESGLHENIAVMDFRSLYPTVMVAHNISPDTLNVEDCDESFEMEEFNYSFCQDFQGFFPELVENLVEERYQLKSKLDDYKDGSKKYNSIYNRQEAEKILANSVGPDTHIVFKNPEDQIIVKSIEEFYDSLERSEELVQGSRVKEVSSWKVLSVEGDKAVFKPVYAASLHEPEDAYRVRTRMGEVTVTGDHSLISMDGEPSNRIRDSSFDGLEKVKGSKITKDDIIAQVNNLELNESSQEIIVPDNLKDCPEDFYLYIPKSENLEKRDWYERRVRLIEAVEEGMDSSDINSSDSFGNKVLANARNEGLVRQSQIVGSQGNIYECEVTEKGKKYKKFYDTFQKREKNSKHYLIALDQIEELPPRDILEQSYVANKSGRARNKIPAVLELDEEVASLLGWFVAEGHFRQGGTEKASYNDSAIASDNPQQREEIQRLFKQVFDYDASVNARQVSCCTSTIARLFSELCGDKADTKKVPEPMFNCEKSVREAFLEAYTLGDGDEDGRRFSTISKKLQSGLSTLLKEQDTILHNGYDTETYRISKRTKTQGQKIVSGDLYGQTPIEAQKTEKPEKVYDISVEDTEKFVTAEGLVLHNSFYGYLGYNGARWYSRESAEATTYLGREYIQKTIEKAEEKGYEVAYGDTDSVFLKKDNIQEDIDDFVADVNEDLPRFMELEFEGFFKRGFFTSTDSGEGAKKKYALLSPDGSMKITGFEQVRRDWSPIAKDTQKQVLQHVLNEEIDEAVELVKDVIERLKDDEVPPEELRIYTTLTKPPEEYDSTAPHVEAVKKAKNRGDDIEAETTISYVVTRGSGNISSRAELTKYAEDYDAEYYIENQIIPVSLRVLKVFGYTEGQLLGKGRQSGLGRFN